MNNTRRKELYAVAEILEKAKDANKNDIADLIEDAKQALDTILYDEESYMDNIPENLQSSYRYQVAEDACANIECAMEALDNGDIKYAISYIYGATV